MSMLSIVKELPKPFPFLQALNLLVDAGYNRTIAADQITINAMNSHDYKGMLRDKQTKTPSGYSMMDGMLVSAHCIPPFEEKGIFITKKDTLHGKYLILIPCNAGAMVGDYFTKNTRRSVARYFPERTTCLDFAATDSITTVTKDGKGLIVFENEMNRVKGHDLFPTFNKQKLNECNDGIKISEERLGRYQSVFSFLNVRLYDEAVQSSSLTNIIRVPIEYKQDFFLQGIPRLRSVFEQFADPVDLIAHSIKEIHNA